MSNTRQCQYCQNIIVVLGRQWGRLDTEPPQCLIQQINNTVIISTPDASKLNDKHMVDFVALTFHGPHLFLVVLEEGKKPEEELRKWEKVFGENISHNMRYITDGPYDDSKLDKCISTKGDIIKQCDSIINKQIHSRYSFDEIMKRRRMQIESQMAAKTDRFPAPGAQQKSRHLTLVLIGETGSGKSVSGNTIMGMKAFPSKSSSMPVTTECEMKTTSICGIEVRVIDTPVLSDEDRRHIQRCRELCEGGLCVYLLVIQIGRFTEGERGILERLEKALQTRVRDRAIILFTRGDDLGSESEIDEYVRNTNPHLQQLIKKCGGRYQVISNTTSHKTEAEKQVKQLMEKIGKLVKIPKCDEDPLCVIA